MTKAEKRDHITAQIYDMLVDCTPTQLMRLRSFLATEACRSEDVVYIESAMHATLACDDYATTLGTRE